ncbi:MFS transporter (plasmid) [Sphingobium sp. SJ10-10]|uniref:MFS transporter n=1 Tax=Sphingobium sp. SJ10-10 TaxID=3114999 RepID=UPI002E17E422|nr:MFS transporter [Sphingobium sp. SJ10-10]
MATTTPFAGWRMVAICFLIMNCTLGVNFSAYGAMVETIQHEFGTSRALAAMGISMSTLTLGLIGPLVGGLLRRMSIRTLIMIGLTLNASGYFLLSQVHDIRLFLAIFALMVGPGLALAGVVPCTAIISNWFVVGRGRAIGIINIPLGNALLPLMSAGLLIGFGLKGALWGNGIVLAALLPLAWFLVDRPAQIGQQPAGGIAQDRVAAEPALSAAQIVRLPRFLILTLGVGLLSAAGLAMVTHLVALASDRGVPLGSASLLLSVFGLAGLVGAPLFGWLSDRIGGGTSFALLSLIQIAPWLGLIVAGANLPLLLVLAFTIGLFSNGIITLFGVTMGEWLGQANIGLGMGLCYLFKIPFLFAAGPLAGAMFDRFGNYTPTILMHVATFVAVGLTFLLYRPKQPRDLVSSTRPSTV